MPAPYTTTNSNIYPNNSQNLFLRKFGVFFICGALLHEVRLEANSLAKRRDIGFNYTVETPI